MGSAGWYRLQYIPAVRPSPHPPPGCYLSWWLSVSVLVRTVLPQLVAILKVVQKPPPLLDREGLVRLLLPHHPVRAVVPPPRIHP